MAQRTSSELIRFAIVGPGRVGRMLGRALVRRGYVLAGVIARRREQAEATAAELAALAGGDAGAGWGPGAGWGARTGWGEGTGWGAAAGAAEGRSPQEAGPSDAPEELPSEAGLHGAVWDATQGAVRAATLHEALEGVDLLLVTTPDRAIAPVAQLLADAVRSGAESVGDAEAEATSTAQGGGADVIDEEALSVVRVAFHTSGALSASELAPLEACGFELASAHPIQSFASVDTTEAALQGIAWGIEGMPVAVQRLEHLVTELGGSPLRLRPGGKALYHAGACVAANYLPLLIEHALRLYEAAGIERAAALPALIPLMEGTLRNARELGVPGALTGPIERGDAPTVQRHLEALESGAVPSETATFYRWLGEQTVQLAEAKGSLSQEEAERLRSLLAGGEGGEDACDGVSEQ